jgi:hypothetical protein
MAVRAKFTVSAITDRGWSKEVELTCQYDQSIPVDQRLQKATPTGSIKMQIDNPAALEQFKLGAQCYADFTFLGR